jgi:hypothetical protein
VALVLSAFGAGQPASGGPLDAMFDGMQQRRKPLPRHSSAYADPTISQAHASRRAAPSGQRLSGQPYRAAPSRAGQRLSGEGQRLSGESQRPSGKVHRPSRESGGSTGHGIAFCVRTCDGRYFPMQRHAGASHVEACRSFCPAAKTVVLTGSKIESAVGHNGTRYTDLNTAFTYRKKVVADCTCNGKDEFGLARVGSETDPTLRPGDIVATSKGLGTYASKSAAITPINPASSEWARRLSETKVRPAQSQVMAQATAEATGTVADDVNPAKLKNEAKPEKTAKEATSTQPAKDAKSAKAVKEAQPAKPAKEAKPAKPVKEAKPAKLAKGIKPAKLATQTKPAKPTKPVKTAKLTTQVKPAKPVKEVKTAKLIRRASR